MNLFCPIHHLPLESRVSEEIFYCSSGCTFPLIKGIPRFVSSDEYASSFGLQWNSFRRTQLDSFTGLSISRDRLTRLAGGSLDIMNGKTVLESGCGAGRFTEIMLSAGAHVFAADISNAVEANYTNCKEYSNYFICQADILKLPVLPEKFDMVICVGVIQHTPDPEETISVLCSHVKPGGMLVIDHYSYGHEITLSRRILRSFLIKRSKIFSMRFCRFLTGALWPFHKLFWKMRKIPVIRSVRSRIFLKLSPVVDYQDAYSQLGSQLLYEWAVLDTHDSLTDVYKHIRSAEEIHNHLQQCGMTEIETVYAGNGVEARARKPLSS